MCIRDSMATIFAWSGAFKKRGELDGLPELVKFGEALEADSLQTLNDGIMTKDLWYMGIYKSYFGKFAE